MTSAAALCVTLTVNIDAVLLDEGVSCDISGCSVCDSYSKHRCSSSR